MHVEQVIFNSLHVKQVIFKSLHVEQVIFNKHGIDSNASITFDELVNALINNTVDISEDEHRLVLQINYYMQLYSPIMVATDAINTN